MRFNRYQVSAVALAVAITATACGSKSEAPQSPTPAAGTSTAPATTQTPATDQWIPLTGPLAGAAAKPVTIRFMGYAGSPYEEANKAMIAEFHKQYPNVKVQHEVIPFAEIYRKILTEIAASSPPDVIFADGPAVAGYAAQGAFLDLTPFVPEEDKKDFYPSSLSEGSWDGKLFGLASEQSAHVVYYRQDAFDEAGIKPPDSLDKGWTWTEAKDALKKVTKMGPGGGIPTRFGMDRVIGQYAGGAALRSAGDPKAAKDSSLYKTYYGISDDGKTVKGYQDSPEMIQAVQFFQDMWKEQIMPKDAIPDAMPTGKAAAWVGAEWAEGKLLSQYKDLKWGVTPMPYFKTPTVHTGSWTYGVTARSKNQKEAVLFTRWMTSPQAEKLQFKFNPQLPARRSVARELDAYKQYPKSLTLQSFEQWGAARLRSPIFPQYQTLQGEMYNNIIAGANAEREVKMFADKMQQTLDQFWSTRK